MKNNGGMKEGRKEYDVNPVEIAIKLRELYIDTTDKNTAQETINKLKNRVYQLIQDKRKGKSLGIEINEEITLEILKKCAEYIMVAVVLARSSVLDENPKDLLQELCEDPQISEILKRISTSEALNEYENLARTVKNEHNDSERAEDTVDPVEIAIKLRELYIDTTDKNTAQETINKLKNRVYQLIQDKRKGKSLGIEINEEITLEILKKCAEYIMVAVVLARSSVLDENPKDLLQELCEEPQISEILKRISTSQALKEYEELARGGTVANLEGINPQEIRNKAIQSGVSLPEINRTGKEMLTGQQQVGRKIKFAQLIQVEPQKVGDKNEITRHKALGDIHGEKKAYDRAMAEVKQNESVVLVGDVIDRGTDGIEILLDLIQRRANEEGSNIVFLMGNHELSMLESLRIIKKYGFDKLEAMVEFGRKSNDVLVEVKQLKSEEEKQQKIEEYKETDYYKQNIEKFTHSDVERLRHWIDEECGIETLNKFLALPEEQQNKITSFLEEAYIAYNQVVKGENKLYVHSRPFKNMDIIRGLKGKNGGVRLKDLEMKDVIFCLCNRDEDTFTPCLKEGFFTICGHTKTPRTTIIDRQKGFICLDEGCGSALININTTVGLYCIEDNRVMHIRSDGEIEEENAGIEVIKENGETMRVKGTAIPPNPDVPTER